MSGNNGTPNYFGAGGNAQEQFERLEQHVGDMLRKHYGTVPKPMSVLAIIITVLLTMPVLILAAPFAVVLAVVRLFFRATINMSTAILSNLDNLPTSMASRQEQVKAYEERQKE